MKKFVLTSIIALSTLPITAMAKPSPSTVKVHYMCEGNQHTNVTYSFNKQGIPTKATTIINGKVKTLQYDLDKSDNTDTYFKNAQGDMIGMNVLTRQNVRTADAVTITNTNNEIVYKACAPEKTAKKHSKR